jgi:hypothetical protein
MVITGMREINVLKNLEMDHSRIIYQIGFGEDSV